ncbi:MAG: hypothetical protein Q8M01_08045 [Rubrivivax sp.]|nr:hypothetical protein [Rubrivivax sp.]
MDAVGIGRAYGTGLGRELGKGLRGSLVALVLLGLAAAALAQPAGWRPVLDEARRADAHRHWLCDYSREADGVLYLRCDDLARLLDDGPAADGPSATGGTVYVPVWSQPKSAAAAADLAQRVLCHAGDLCSVAMGRGAGRLRASLY